MTLTPVASQPGRTSLERRRLQCLQRLLHLCSSTTVNADHVVAPFTRFLRSSRRRSLFAVEWTEETTSCSSSMRVTEEYSS